MPATWVVGDIHGCAEELHELLQRLRLGPHDRFLSVGDLYHHGPDPYGVCSLLAALPQLGLVLGNHERALLRRAGLAGRRADGADAPPLPADLAQVDRRGDRRAPLAPVSDEQFAQMLALLERRPYFLEGPDRPVEGPNRPVEGPGWRVVHAGLEPGVQPRDMAPDALVRMNRISALPGKPYWHEVYEGPELVLYGHLPGPRPRARHAGGRLVALGVDTGCVYGGSLTAACIETGEVASVPAAPKRR